MTSHRAETDLANAHIIPIRGAVYDAIVKIATVTCGELPGTAVARRHHQPSVRACAADAKARDAHELWSERTAQQERLAAVLAQQEASRRERDEAHERRVRDLSHQLTETSRQALEEEVLAPHRPAPPQCAHRMSATYAAPFAMVD
jgi:hypothetical protein